MFIALLVNCVFCPKSMIISIHEEWMDCYRWEFEMIKRITIDK
uniref:Uncharacterized protein n=1 Tax=Rhizophora mucronata TaxID=61149 RepID=A0A2P2QBX0_RHIMU